MRDGDNYPESFGPYLRYAISTGFRNFALLDRNPPSFDRSRRDLFFLVKFHKAGQAEDFARDLQAIAPGNPEFRVEYGPEEKNFQHVTMLAGRAVLGSETFGTWDGYVSRVELSLPVRPTSADKILQGTLSKDGASSTSLQQGV